MFCKSLATLLLGICPFQRSYCATIESASASRRAATTGNNNLPPYLSNGSSTSQTPPWGKTSPSLGNAPNTGVTRYYHFEITRGAYSPDGYQKIVLLVNGQSPGPLIQANWGDWISVTVVNQIENQSQQEGLSLHWHGFLQKQTPWFDGVPGVSQCPIAPGKSLTYTFQADEFGTSWYHSHFSSQYSDGAFGPIVIYGPVQPKISYDNDLGTFVFNDYNHATYETVVKDSLENPPKFLNIDNILLNGVACQTTSGICDWNATYPKLSRYTFQSGKTYRMRFINSGTYGSIKISIDNHQMTIFANDFVSIQPVSTKVVLLGIGQRADVIVTANERLLGNAVFLRGDIDPISAADTFTNGEARAIILYDDTPPDTIPTSLPTSSTGNAGLPEPLSSSIPAYPEKPPSPPGPLQTFNIEYAQNSSGVYVFAVNNSTFHSDYNTPLLPLASQGNTSYRQHAEWNVYPFTTPSIQVVFYNFAPFVHPMHLHGHNFWVLDTGFGPWKGTVQNPTNPTRRDTQLMAPGSAANPSYIALQVKLDNPGVWPFHCHVQVHVSPGLLVNFLEHPQQIQTTEHISAQITQTCKDWMAFTQGYIVDEIDSGVKN